MKDLEQILAQCLDDIQSGRASIEDCLERYPAWREELGPLLSLALRLPPMPDVQPSQEFRLRVRRVVQQEIARRGALSWIGQILAKIPRPRLRVLPRLATTLVAALLIVTILLGSGVGVAYASQGSLPGDLLYPVKIATEQGRLLLTFSSAGKAEYHLELAQTRLKEITSLARSRRSINPDTVEAIAGQVDAALVEVRKISSKDAQSMLDEFSTGVAKQRIALANAKKQAALEAIPSLTQTELLVQRAELITKALSEEPTRLMVPFSVKAARESKLKGPISSLDPLRVAGLHIALPPGIKVEGTLIVGRVAAVKGILLDEGTLRASHIKVEEGEDSACIEIRGVISRLDPLTVASRTVVLAQDATVEGVPQVGLIASIEGWLQEDGSILASDLEVEHLKKETKLRGPVTTLEPLTVRKTVIVLAPDAEIEGVLRVGVVVEVSGRFLEDGRFLASQIEVFRGSGVREEEIEGVIVGITGDGITVEMERGQRLTLRFTDRVRIKWGDDFVRKLSDLQVGQEVKAKLDLSTGTVFEIEVEKRKQQNPR